MIQRHRPGALRRRIGFIGLTALMVGGAFVAQAAVQTKADQPAAQNLSFNSQASPHYPADAVKNRQEGTVILDVLVGTDGKPREVKVNPATQAAPSLIKAASDAAMQWRFNPATKRGKRIESYARVPVNFSLDPLPPAQPGASVPHGPSAPSAPSASPSHGSSNS